VSNTSRAAGLCVLLLGTACDAPLTQRIDDPALQRYAPDQESYTFRGTDIPLWSLDEVEAIEQDHDRTIPYVLPSDPLFSEEYLIWDFWPIRNRNGAVSQFGDWQVVVGMTAPRDSGAGGAGLIARWRYWYSKGDGEWILGGRAFPRGSEIGSRTWAGSTMYDPETGRTHFFYTAIGNVPGGAEDLDPAVFPDDHPASGRPSTAQQMAEASATIRWNDDGVWFEDYSEHDIILSADGQIYSTQRHAIVDEVIYGFRDPWYFRDPETGDDYVLFVGNAAYEKSAHNGVVGVARRGEDGWVLEKPILQAADTSSQLERPHLVFAEDYTYLFFTTHDWTFDPPGMGPEGAYGFYVRGGDWRGDWEPMNDGGLVAGNPPSAPALTYSYLVLPDFQMLSYQKKTPWSDFLAVPSPAIQLEVEGTEARVIEVHNKLGPFSLPDDKDERKPAIGSN